MSDKLTMPEFAKATRRRVDEVKAMVYHGDIPYTPGRYIGRDSEMRPMYAPMIDANLVEAFSDPMAARRDALADPRTRRDEVMQSIAGKRNHAVATEAGEPVARRNEAVETLERVNREAQAALRQLIGLRDEND